MATVPDDQGPPVGTTSIGSWYSNCRPLWLDVVGDYAGQELFLIEGDSLLRECFEDSRIDFDDGFQLLHAVYVVERFLENLTKRHCQFHIGFIEENAELCVPDGLSATRRSYYLLAREVIKRHLSFHLPSPQQSVEVHTFPSLESQQFKEYLQNFPVHFVMAHDGASRTSGHGPLLGNKEVRILLRGMIWWFNHHKLNVALINRTEFKDSKLFTMIVESFTLPIDIRLTIVPQFMDEISTARSELSSKIQEGITGETETPIGDISLDELLASSKEAVQGESFYLAISVVCDMLKQHKCDVFMASAFLLHWTVLRRVPISQRRMALVTFDPDFEQSVADFLKTFSGISRNVLKDQKWDDFVQGHDIACDVIDLVDGRVLRAVIKALCDNSLQGTIPKPIQSDWEVLVRLVKKFTNEDLSLQGSDEVESSKTAAIEDDHKSVSEELAVLPFSNPVFDKHLECIHVTTDTSLSARLGSMKIYRETSHWHNHRKPLNPKQAPPQKVSKWRNPLRTNQFYMSEMTAYAASLTGAKGKALDAETITVGPKRLIKLAEEKPSKPEKSDNTKSKSKNEDVKESKSSGSSKKGTKKAAAGLSKKDQMKADNLERKSGTETDKVFSAWTAVLKDLGTISNDQERYLRTAAYLNSLDSTKTTYLEGDINTYILQSLLNWWASYCKANKKTEGYHVVALIWTTIRAISTSRSNISTEIVSHVTSLSKLLGVPAASSDLAPSGPDRKLSFNFNLPANTRTLQIEISQTELQLDYCGPYMDRMLDAKPDPRVSNFVPDGWQRDVLDQLDANKSVFVVAPTSAGKTFISFYAMEQVLRADNDGVLVYVAPTKALVNQIAAEVQGRFSKKYPLTGKGVWAIHTRDYRVNNSTGCQILVTVPHILQIMLLSPSNAKSWAPRVRRIIFDEVHSIGQAEDGVVWEQLLLLAPCPIIALSATVGNPEAFSEWLTETQKSTGSELKMIKHSTRYSDLRKYMYEPPTTFRFAGLGNSYGVGLGLDGLLGFEPVHPISSLIDKSRGMPDDLALEPRDCFSLWRAMVKFQTDEYKVPESLDPNKVLPPCIRKADIFSWEKELKKVLLEWMGDDHSPFDQTVAELTSSKTIKAHDEIVALAESLPAEEDAVDPLDLKATTLPMLYQLHKRRALPAILFNYDRSGCEDIASTLLSQLVDAETKWKQGAQWTKLMEGYEKYKEQKEKKSRKPAKPSKKTNNDDDEGGSKTDRMREESSEGSSSYDMFDPEAPQPDFSFANPKKLQRAELDKFVHQLRRKYIKEDLIDLLKRGIGVHHAGMNRKYRQCVEMLFRKGFLRVVIATGTLSLGINMPCATVVFSGDSAFLTALNFRQAAGRSGRRGFDLLGNVVFQGVPRERADRLLSSRLPEITGHFPITTTLVLRMFTLLNDSDGSKYAKNAVNALLSHPRLYLGGKSFKEQVLHHLRFSIEYLRKNDLLGPRGEPVNFAGCVSHLYFTENSSFAFHALLKGGYFHTLCADIDKNTDMVLQKMLLILSHLFGRRACRVADSEEEAENIKRSPSVVYLPPMPRQAAQLLRDHNKTTLDTFATYVKTFSAQHLKEEECTLPFTQSQVGSLPSKGVNGITPEDPSTFDFLPSLPTPHARSAFFALSGLGDEFTTIEDLCSSTRDGVFLEAAVIPHLELHPDETRSPLNAYLLDFYMHGSTDALEKANGIRKSDVWFFLNDFSLVLATIVTSLALYLGLGADTDPEMLDIMGSGDIAENEGDEEMAAAAVPASEPDSTMSGKSASTQQAPTIKKKKKVVDDWDAGEDALDEEEKFRENENVNRMGVTDDEEYDKLMHVYKAFRKLKAEFDSKFREIWA